VPEATPTNNKVLDRMPTVGVALVVGDLSWVAVGCPVGRASIFRIYGRVYMFI
jgi:hypothetical protein